MPRKFTNNTKRVKVKPETLVVLPEINVEKQIPHHQKWWLVGLISFISALALGLVVTVVIVMIFLQRFTAAAQLNYGSLQEIITKGLTQDAFGLDHQVTFLLLGLDLIGEQRGDALLTDSIILATLKENGQVVLVSIPRDLWIDRLKTKVNALYYYGEKERTGGGKDYTKQVLTEITGVPIDYVITLDVDSVKKAVDVMGGITVGIPNTFTDVEYPRDGADLSSTDPAVLYKTVSFNQGNEHMSGERVLEYIRSRKSESLAQGTDNARQERQQTVIHALTKQVIQKDILFNPTLLGQLYTLWKSTMGKEIPDWVILAIGRRYYGQPIELQSVTIPSTFDTPSPEDILYNPPISKYNQWVYEPQDPSWKALHSYFGQFFGAAL